MSWFRNNIPAIIHAVRNEESKPEDTVEVIEDIKEHLEACNEAFKENRRLHEILEKYFRLFNEVKEHIEEDDRNEALKKLFELNEMIESMEEVTKEILGVEHKLMK